MAREREGVNHSFRANCAPADPSAASLPPTIPEKSRPIVYITGLAWVSFLNMASRKASKSQWNRCRDIRGKCERAVCRAR